MGEFRPMPPACGPFEGSGWADRGPKSIASLGLRPCDCDDSGDGSVKVSAVDAGADDWRSLKSPSSFSSNLSVLDADGLFTVLRRRTVCIG